MKEFFEICARKGITLTLKDGKNISYRTSKGPLEKDILAYLKEHKTEIIEYLKSNEQADKMIDESKIIHNEKDRYQYFVHMCDYLASRKISILSIDGYPECILFWKTSWIRVR